MDKISSFRGQYFFLSNFYEAPVTFHGVAYKCNEAAYQAQKTIMESERIPFQTMTGTEAKTAGKKVTLRDDWDDVKKHIMLDLLYVKFTQNPNLAALLLNTGDAYLEEGNTWGDTFWGVCNGKGANYLGRCLMKVRDVHVYQMRQERK